MPRHFRHKHPVVPIHRHRNRPLETAFPFRQILGNFPPPDNGRIQRDPFSPPLRQAGIPGQLRNVVAAGRKNLHPVILVIGRINQAVPVHRYPGRTIELPRPVPGLPELQQKLPVAAELLDPVIAPIGNEHRALPVNSNAPGHIKLAGAAAETAKGKLKLARRIKNLHPAVPAVHQIEVIVSVKSQPGRTVKLPFGAACRPPLAAAFPVFVKNGNAVQPFVSHISLAPAVQSHRRRPEKDAGRRRFVGILRMNLLPELPHQFLLDGADSDPLAGKQRRRFRAAAQHIEQIPFAPGQGNRMIKPVAAAQLLPPDGMGSLISYRRYRRRRHYAGHRCLAKGLSRPAGK